MPSLGIEIIMVCPVKAFSQLPGGLILENPISSPSLVMPISFVSFQGLKAHRPQATHCIVSCSSLSRSILESLGFVLDLILLSGGSTTEKEHPSNNPRPAKLQLQRLRTDPTVDNRRQE